MWCVLKYCMSTCSHHCYTEEKNVTLNEYLYVDLDKLFLKEQHAFPLKVRPTNLQAHIDKLSIKIKRRVVNGQTFSFHSLYSSFKFHDNVNVSALIIGNWLLELCLLFQFHHGIIIWLLFDFVPLVLKLLDLIIIWLKTNLKIGTSSVNVTEDKYHIYTWSSNFQV